MVKYYTLKRASKMTGLSRPTLYKYLERGIVRPKSITLDDKLVYLWTEEDIRLVKKFPGFPSGPLPRKEGKS